MSGLECPCCGDPDGARSDARGHFYDGQPLACGCEGQVMLDAETPPGIDASDCPCGDPEALRETWMLLRGQNAALEAQVAEAQAELGKLQLSHKRTRTELNTLRAQRDEHAATIARVRAVRAYHGVGWRGRVCHWGDVLAALEPEGGENGKLVG